MMDPEDFAISDKINKLYDEGHLTYLEWERLDSALRAKYLRYCRRIFQREYNKFSEVMGI